MFRDDDDDDDDDDAQACARARATTCVFTSCATCDAPDVTRDASRCDDGMSWNIHFTGEYSANACAARSHEVQRRMRDAARDARDA